MNKQQINIAKIIERKRLFVNVENVKNKNALKLIIPSEKIAKTPQYSVNKAPVEIAKRGTDITRISIMVFNIFIFFSTLKEVLKQIIKLLE